MAKAVIRTKNQFNLKSIKDSSSRKVDIQSIDYNAKIIDESFQTKTIKQKDYPTTSIIDQKPVIKIKSTLPFRVRFTTITVPGYGPNNVPPIGIALIGINNYIL